ncbi:MAG: hypothetical protein A3I05_05890 [Deltaproteobacteria bacterium RIFCSPLOWO2_02_FULL_44_10]|nr:MAG: hypothetical protein A3C46_04715 [Deltaproteobacteria bacterium RIFCSPHIGHO2_02_FULL_44_16]OGQ46161.1 MAG: hypothetical protein A3I05_05890 [Deltaproteobacteria bacterium RIFCSPLOWO2_02_FULL_44_10]
MKDAIEEGVFPDAELLVAHHEEILFHKSYGRARKGSLFDIASLTKPICTATLTMLFHAKELIKLEDTVYQWLAGARLPFHRQITVEMLLHHFAGYIAWQPYYRELPLSMIGTEEGRDFIFQECLREPLIHAPGEKTVYSDIGSILLGKILEEAGDHPLDILFQEYIAAPLKLHDTFFIPTHTHSARANRRFIPTQDCPWRGRILKGEVDNANAYALGGVAGHAGLFSTASDLHIFLKAFTQSLSGKNDWIPPETVRAFFDFEKAWSRKENDTFVGGWNLITPGRSSSGHSFSKRSIGHLAYTGCSLWIDLEKEVWVILLTNRVHPSMTNEKIKSFRPQLHDLIMKELILNV